MDRNFDWQRFVDEKQIKVFPTLPDGWKLLHGATCFPKGYAWACNGRNILETGYKQALVSTGHGNTLRYTTAS